MSKNASSSGENSRKWTNNLTKFQDSLKSRSTAMQEKLQHLNRMPSVEMIINRFKTLANSEKKVKERIKILIAELMELWNKFSFPVVATSTISWKIEKLINWYNKNLKRPSCNSDFSKIFDITSSTGIWLCKEDKDFYKLQLETHGKVGYSTAKKDMKIVHPSKKRKIEAATNTKIQTIETDQEITESEKETEFETTESEDISDTDSQYPKKRRYNSCKAAVDIVVCAKLPVRKAAKICETLYSCSGIEIATPCTSGVYKATMKSAEDLKNHYKNELKKDSWCLHFDGKQLKEMVSGKVNKIEHHVIVLKNAKKEVRLGALILEDGHAETIYNGIKLVLDDYDLWGSICMIVADTCAVNTGRKNGVITCLQRHFIELGQNSPIFIGCQHHILDTVLKHCLNQLYGQDDIRTDSPQINYPFVSYICNSYQELKDRFKNGNEELEYDNLGWRDDMKLLYHLIYAYKFYIENNRYPKVNLPTVLPNLSNARWNSRAIYALLAFILCPKKQDNTLKEACDFIVKWSDFWFGDHLFDPNNYDQLETLCAEFKKALKSVKTFWSQEPSPIPTQRSNICAERGIKILQDLKPLCKSQQKLNLRFVLSNKKTH